MKFYLYQIVKSTGKNPALKDDQEYRITDLEPAGEEADTFTLERKGAHVGMIGITVKAEDIEPVMLPEAVESWDDMMKLIKAFGFDQDEYFDFSDNPSVSKAFSRTQPIWDETEIRTISTYVVPGGSEGYYVHVDRSVLANESVVMTKSEYNTAWKQRSGFRKTIGVEQIEIKSEPYFKADIQRVVTENIMLGKFWSWDRAEEAVRLIQRTAYGQTRYL